MDINKALELFSITDIMEETEETLKKKYKKLMIKYHPDTYKGGDDKAKDITVAMDILKNAIKQINQYKLINTKTEQMTLVIPLHKLIELYSGKEITLGSADKQMAFNIKSIRKHNVLIMSDIAVTHNGLTQIFSNVQPWQISDNFEINCEIYVTKLDNPEKINIKLEGLDRELQIKSQSLRFKMQLPYSITMDVVVTKKIKVDKKDVETLTSK